MKKLSFWRYLTIAIMLGLIGTSILVQIVRIQNSPEVAGVTGQGAYIWKTFYPARGEIYDRNGNLLAGNKTVYEIGVDLTALPAAKDAALKMENDIALAAQIDAGHGPRHGPVKDDECPRWHPVYYPAKITLRLTRPTNS